MNIHDISPTEIALSFVPFFIFVFSVFYWSLNWKDFLVAMLRMLIQLISIGYVLTFLFNKNHWAWTFSIMIFMLLMASWISLRSIRKKRKKMINKAILALLFGSTPVLLWVTGIVLPGSSMADPGFLIPLAGMVYANAMNTLGIAAERFEAEVKRGHPLEALQKALNACLISHFNMLIAVGIVSLPGLMTGQILSGVDPLIAVRYQIVVMLMVVSSSGLTASIYLWLAKKHHSQSLTPEHL